MKQYFFILSALFLCLGMAGCSSRNDEDFDDPDAKIGIVKYLPPPDDCNDYIIRIDKEIYKPNNLPEAFKQDNLQVKITFTITDKEHNCGFSGYRPIINIIKIKKL